MVSERDAPTDNVTPARTRERRAIKAAAGLAVAVLGVIGFASYKLAVGAGHAGKTAVSPRGVVAVSPVPRTRAASPPASASTAVASPSVVPVRALRPVSAAAFGPEGTADGDGSQQAGYAIDASLATNWRTDWYATSLFGGLQSGTGMLIDMGHVVTISSVQVTLGSAHGADLELRAGDTATLAALPRVATSTGAGGTLQFKLAKPVQARYLLLWFTALPPDGAGSYQAWVYNVGVTGQP